ncbi:MAG: DinB family protein [candidate division Zixibacteria bacterium]|nr:DinB family protein [candidate division Zixibacteria bacterium]
MKKWELKIAPGFDPKTQKQIGLFSAQLDDQLSRLKKELKGLTVKQLEWQLKPGMNTIGMLLAHFAIAEVWWILIASKELPWETKGKQKLIKVCGLEDDGIPLATDGLHPKYLKGFSLDKYLKILNKSRRAVRKELKTWRDRDLNKFYTVDKMQATPASTIYHVLEHFCGHFGQILLLKHLLRDAKLLK